MAVQSPSYLCPRCKGVYRLPDSEPRRCLKCCLLDDVQVDLLPLMPRGERKTVATLNCYKCGRLLFESEGVAFAVRTDDKGIVCSSCFDVAEEKVRAGKMYAEAAEIERRGRNLLLALPKACGLANELLTQACVHLVNVRRSLGEYFEQLG